MVLHMLQNMVKRYGRTYEGIMPDWEPGKRYILLDIVWVAKRYA